MTIPGSVVIAAMIALLPVSQAGAETGPPLVVPAEISLTLPKDVPAVDLPVQRRDGKPLVSADLHVTQMSIEGPGEAAVTIEPPRAAPNGDGILARLRVGTAATMRPGTYAVRLQVRDSTPGRAPAQELATLKIDVQPAAIEPASLLPRVAVLMRESPFRSASGTLHFTIRPTALQGLPDLRAEAGEVRRQIAPGSAGAGSAGESMSGNAADAMASVVEAAPRTVGPGQTVPVTLRVDGLRAVGDWRTEVTLRASTLPAVTFPVTVTVTDGWPLPTVTILIGVGLGLGLTAIRSNLRPRFLARQRLFALAQRIEELAPAAADNGGNDALTLAALRQTFDGAMQDLDADIAPATAESAAAALETSIAAFRTQLDEAAKGVITQGGTVRDAIDALRTTLGRLGQLDLRPATPEEEAALSAAERSLASAQTLAVQRRSGSAKARLGAATTALDALRVSVVRDRLGLLRQAADQDATAQPKVVPLLDQAATAVALRPVTAAKLDEALDRLSAAGHGLYGRPRAAATLASLRPAPTRQAAVTIDCIPDSPAARTAATLVVNLPPGVAPGSVAVNGVEWNFGDGEAPIRGDLRIEHVFTAARVHLVTALLDSGMRAELTVLVGPSAAALGRQHQTRMLRRIDLLLALFAALVATVVGLQQLYIGKVFGSVSDYAVALLWGFGIDQTVRGVADALAKVR